MRGPQLFQASGPVDNVNHSELRDFNALNHDNAFFHLNNDETEDLKKYVYNNLTGFSHPHSSALRLSSALHDFLILTNA